MSEIGSGYGSSFGGSTRSGRSTHLSEPYNSPWRQAPPAQPFSQYQRAEVPGLEGGHPAPSEAGTHQTQWPQDPYHPQARPAQQFPPTQRAEVVDVEEGLAAAHRSTQRSGRDGRHPQNRPAHSRYPETRAGKYCSQTTLWIAGASVLALIMIILIIITRQKSG